MGTYREGDADKIIVMESDDGGLTWHAPNDNTTYREADLEKVIILEAVPAPPDWEPPA